MTSNMQARTSTRKIYSRLMALTILIAGGLFALPAEAGVVFTENFDTYATGATACARNAAKWTTCSNGAEFISNTVSSSAANSLYINRTTSDANAVTAAFGAITGQVQIEFTVYPTVNNRTKYVYIRDDADSTAIALTLSSGGKIQYNGGAGYTDICASAAYVASHWYGFTITTNAANDTFDVVITDNGAAKCSNTGLSYLAARANIDHISFQGVSNGSADMYVDDITVTSIGSLTFSAGAANPAASNPLPNDQDVEVLQLNIAESSGVENVNITQLVLTGSGTSGSFDERNQTAGGDIVDLGVCLYNDSGSTAGTLDGTDSLISCANYSADNGTVTFAGLAEQITSGASENWLLVYDLRNPASASLSENFRASITASSTTVTATGATTGLTAGRTGTVTGNLHTLSSGNIAVATGSSNPGTGNVVNSAQNVAMLQLAISESTGRENVTVTQIQFTGSGSAGAFNERSTASGGDMSANGVCIYVDGGTNAGSYDASDTLLACGNYAADNGTVTLSGFSRTITAGSSENWLLTYNLAGSAALTETFRASITATTPQIWGTGVSSGVSVTTSGGTINGSYKTIAAPSIAVSKSGAQPSTAVVRVDNKVMGSFTFSGSGTITAITIKEASASFSAQTHIDAVKLYYDNDGTYSGDETQFGASTTFNASEKATFNDSIAITTTTTYVYVLIDVSGYQFSGSEYIDIEINASADVTTTGASKTGSFPVQLTNSTLVVAGQITSLAISPTTAEIDVNGTQQFTATGQDADGNTTSSVGTLTWSCTSTIGSINPTLGFFTGSSVGAGTVSVSSSYGPSNSVPITVLGTTANGNYSYRKQITVTNNVAETLPAGYSVKLSMDHSACYNGGSGKCEFANGNDVRIFYFDGSDYVQIDRVNEPGYSDETGGLTDWNDTDTEIWFPTQADIAASGTDDNYWLYYGNANAGTPPSSRSAVYLWHDDFSSDSLSNYINGKQVGIIGTNTSLITYDSTNDAAAFDTGASTGAGLRIPNLDLEDVLVQADFYPTGFYTTDYGTLNLTLKWNSNTSAYYSHVSSSRVGTAGGTCAGGANGASSDCITDASPGGRTTDVATCADIKIACNATKRLRYGIYNGGHKFWNHKRTSSTPDSSGTDATITSGGVGVQANQMKGRFDNLLVRYFVYPEPTTALGSEEVQGNYKVEGIHTFTTQVSQGEQYVQILRISIATAVTDTLDQVIVTGANTSNGDITGVSAYYTGISTTFETSTPFGTTNQTFSATNTVTFSGSQELPSNSTVYLFIVYNVTAVAANTNVLDALIEAGNITLGSGSYPTGTDIDPTGSRSIASPQELDAIEVVNSNTGTALPGEQDVELLRIDFNVSGTGSPQTLQSITLTSKNVTDSDVTGVSAYYTGTSTTFSTAVPFGETNRPFGDGSVTISGTLDLDTANATHSVFITYNLADDAVDGHTIDAEIETNNIRIESSPRSPVNGDPSGSRTITMPTSTETGWAPCKMEVSMNPSYESTYAYEFYNVADQGDCATNNTIGSLETDNNSYAGLTMNTPPNIFDNQQQWVTFSYNLSSLGITGESLTSLTFKSQLFLTGQAAGTSPNATPAGWDTVYDSKVQIYNFDTMAWEDMQSSYLSPISTLWNTTTESDNWTVEANAHKENPLNRAKVSDFSDSYMNSSGILKIRVWQQGYLSATSKNATMVFDYATIDFNYGSNVEEANWMWLNNMEAPEGKETGTIIIGENTDLHLRTGIRSNFADLGAHYLGIEFNTDPTFPAPHTNILTTGSGDLRHYDATDSATGDTVGIKLLTGSDRSGMYHEVMIPPVQSKSSGKLYEEDFTITTPVTGTYYARTVLTNPDGTYSGPLDAYTAPVKLDVQTIRRYQYKYKWITNEATPVAAAADDTALDLQPGTTYIVAICFGTENAGPYDWKLQYQKNPYTAPSEWMDVNTGSADWQAVDGPWGVDNDDVDKDADFVICPGTYTRVDGKYDEAGDGDAMTLAGNKETEFWYSIQPQTSALGNAYRFRIIGKYEAQLINYVLYPEANDMSTEQVSYIWADDTEASIGTENTMASVAKDQPLHLRVGVRKNHGAWDNHYFALQYDTNPDFTAPTIVTTSTTEVSMWDDTGHADGDTMTGSKFLDEGDALNGKYHEDNIPPAASTKERDDIYEEDFTVVPNATGTYYFRVVTVDPDGTNPQELEVYSSGDIGLTVSIPTNTQQYYSWAEDEATPDFQVTNTTLGFAPGNNYIVAFQIENSGTAQSVYSWELQYKKTSEPQGAWTSVTTTTSDWVVANCQYGVDGKSISSSAFVTNGGVGGGTAERGYYSETGQITDVLGATSYTEYWYCVMPTNNSSKNTYEFRLTNAGSTSGFIYSTNAKASAPTVEMVSYRWSDSGDAALQSENTIMYAKPGEQLHLRVGVRSNYGPMGSHYLGIQYDTTTAFLTPTMMTTGTTPIKMWNDTDHAADSEVSGSKVLSGSPSNGLFHENNTTASQTKSKDVLYEEDFTIQTVSSGTYYIRVVEVDSSGAFLRLLDEYTNKAEITVSDPTLYQTKFQWSQNIGTPAWSTQDVIYDFTYGTDYIIAIKIENIGAVNTAYDWQLQYQEDPYGTAGSWTNVTTTSSKWTAINGAWGADQAAVNTFTTTGTDYCGCAGGAQTPGRYSETGKMTAFTINAGRYTELWYAIRADSSTYGNAYRFRVTNSGNTYGMSYTRTQPAEARIVAKQQASYRWVDAGGSPLEVENTSTTVVEDDYYHLRVGVKARNADWASHRLGIQYDTNSGFTGPTTVTASTGIRYWDDTDYTEGGTLADHMLANSSQYGVYHERATSTAETQTSNYLYEQDFAINPTTPGTYYMRVVTVDAAGAFVSTLDMYTNVIQLVVVPPNNYLSAYNWAVNTATPSFNGTINTAQGETSGYKYIVATRIQHVDPSSTFNWRLQYQQQPSGAWTDITTSSSNDWYAYDGDYGVNGATVATASFVTQYAGALTSTPGKYSETGIINAFSMPTNNTYTELWYAIRPNAAALNNDYRFRITNAGSTTGFQYDVMPEAKHPPTAVSLAITKQNSCCTNDSTPTMTMVCEDPAGTSCTAAHSMRFSCNGTDWSSWVAFSSTYSAFDITTGATGCSVTNENKTIRAQFKNIYNAVQLTAVSDTVVYDTEAPVITNVPDVQSLTAGKDCQLHGTTDGIVCSDPSLFPLPTCTAWYKSATTAPSGDANEFTINVNWTDNMSAENSKWKVQGSQSFGQSALQSPRLSAEWQQWYTINTIEDVTTYDVTMTVYDKVGQSDSVVIRFKPDNEAPNDISASGFASSTNLTALVSNTWYNYPNPYFSWSTVSDMPAGVALVNNAGVDKYYVGFSTDSTYSPVVEYPTTNYTPSSALSCNIYYLRTSAADDVCNISSATTSFIYKYDPSPPTITNNGVVDNTWRNAAGTTYDVDFIDVCGNVKKAEYIIYSGANNTATNTVGWTTIVDNIGATTYTTDWPVVFASLADGTNYVTLRLTDEAGNVIGATDSFYIKKDTVAPTTTISSPAASAWKNAAFTVDVTNADNTGGAGLNLCYYRVVSNSVETLAWTAYGCATDPTITVGAGNNCDTQGTDMCSVEFYDTDLAGNGSSASATTRLFSIDWTAPSVTYNAPASGTWKGSAFDVDISDSDAHSGLGTCEIQVESNNGGWVTTQAYTSRTCNSATSSSVTVGAADMCRDQGPNLCRITVKATDNAGNTATAGSETISIDWTPPASSFNNPAASAWKNTNFDIDTTDSDVGSGISTCEYRVESNGVETQAWAARTACNNATSQNITVSAASMCRDQGADMCAVALRSTDVAGNVSAVATRTFGIDWTPPTATIVSPAASAWKYTDYVVDMTNADTGGSGLATCNYRVLSNAVQTLGWTSYVCGNDPTVTVGATDDCRDENTDMCQIEFYNVDVAGNTGTTATRSISIDFTPPTATVNNPAASSWRSVDFVADITNADGGSGLATCNYRVLSNSVETVGWTAYGCGTDPTLTVGAADNCLDEDNDICQIELYNVDVAGNTGPTTTRAFSIDWEAPDNPSGVSGYATDGALLGLVDAFPGGYVYDQPYFTWSTPDDNPVLPITSSGVAGYYVYFGTDAAAVPTAYQTAATYSATTTDCSAMHYLRVKTDDSANTANVSAPATVYSYFWKGTPIITDNQADDAAWHASNGAWNSWDVDFGARCGNIDYVQYSIWSGPAMTGTELAAWSTFIGPNYATNTHTANWSITGAGWTAATSGVNYVSVRVYTMQGLTDTATDVFSFRKDVVPPDNATSVSGYTDYTGGTAISDSTYYGYPAPYFTWSGAADQPQPLNSGLALYNMYFDTNSAGSPTYATTVAAFLATSALTSGNYYYLRQASEDNMGNATSATTLFTYYYDVTAPDNPTVTGFASDSQLTGIVDALPGGYVHDHPYFTWATPNDNPAGPLNSAGVAGYYVSFGTDAAEVPTNYQTTSSFIATPTECMATYYLRFKTKDNTIPANTSAPATRFTYFWRGTPIITDNQADDATWHATNGAWNTWDVDFGARCGNIDYVEYAIWSGAGLTGTQGATWTTFLGPGLGVNSYATDWSIANADWAAATSGVNFVSVRVYTDAGLSETATDVFSFRKDLVAPNNATSASGYSDWTAGTGITTATYYSYDNPFFTWAGAQDMPQPLNSGISHYRMYFGTNAAGNPTYATSVANYLATSTMVSGNYYYLRQKAVDNLSNATTTATTLFTYYYDKTAPDNPTAPASGWNSIAKLTPIANGGSYPYPNPLFSWSDPDDNPIAPLNSAGVAGYYVSFGTDVTEIPAVYQATNTYVGAPSTCYEPWYLRVRSRDASVPPNETSTAQTMFTFTLTSEISFTDNQPGDNTWRKVGGTLYDVDFAVGCGALDHVDYTVWSRSDMGSGTGSLVVAWSNLIATATIGGASSYSNNFAVPFGSLAEGYNFVSLKIYNTSGESIVATDTFYIKKDTTPPDNATTVASFSDYTSTTPISDSAWYGYAAPYFTWSAPGDLPLPHNSGFDHSVMYFGTDSAGAPSYATSDYGFLATSSMTSGYYYYLRQKNVDAIGNATSATTIFTYYYDTTAPDNPAVPVNGQVSSLDATPIVDGGTYPGSAPYFTWAAPADNPAGPLNSSGVEGYYVSFGTDAAETPSAFQTTTNYTGSPTTCYEPWYLRLRTADNSTPTNTAGVVTAFTYTMNGQVIITDNQTGDDVWRSASGTLYNVDFTISCGTLARVDYAVYDRTGMDSGTGSVVVPWTNLIATATVGGASSYTADFTVPFGNLNEGWNFVSLRGYDMIGNNTTATDAFYIKKDTTPPTIPTSGYTESSDYLWVSPANGSLYYGLGMGAAPQTFNYNGTATDTLSGINNATFNTAFGDSPAADATGASWSGAYTIVAANAVPDTVTVTVYDNAGNSANASLTPIQDNEIQVDFASMTAPLTPMFPTFVQFHLYYPDGVTPMTSYDENLGIGFYATTTAGPDISNFIRAYDGAGTEIDVYDEIADAVAEEFVVSLLEYQTGVADTCGGVISGTNHWCAEFYTGDCVSSTNPHYIRFSNASFMTDGFYGQVDEKSIDGDLGAPVVAPVSDGDDGTFQAHTGPAYAKAYAAGDGLITADKTINNWCFGAACAITCNVGGTDLWCSNDAATITAKPDYVKFVDTIPVDRAFDNVANNSVPAATQWSWDSANLRVMLSAANDPTANAAVVTYTPNGGSELVCVEIKDSCDQTITSGRWHDEVLRLTLSDAPNSGKDIAANNPTISRGFYNVTTPANYYTPDQLVIEGEMLYGAACITLTAETTPSDDPQTPIKVTPDYLGSPALTHAGGTDTAAFVLIRGNGGVASGAAQFAGFDNVEDLFIPDAAGPIQSLVMDPDWSFNGGRLSYVSRQTDPCGAGDATLQTSSYTNFNLYAMTMNAGTGVLDSCRILTSNDSTGKGVYPGSSVTTDNTDLDLDGNYGDRIVFSARDPLTLHTKLMWVSATGTVGFSTGTQYVYPPYETAQQTDYPAADINAVDTVFTLQGFNAGLNVGDTIVIQNINNTTFETDSFVVRTISAYDPGTFQVTVDSAVGMLFEQMGVSSYSQIKSPATLADINQIIVPNDSADWYDPDWSADDSVCGAPGSTNRDSLIAVRAPSLASEDTECGAACAEISAGGLSGTTNPNIVQIYGGKDANDMYDVGDSTSSTSSVRKLTHFTDGTQPLKPKWSPDCSMIAFLVWDGAGGAPANTSVYILNISSANPGFTAASLPITSLSDSGVYAVYNFASSSYSAFSPNWSADGKLVSYSIDRNNAFDMTLIADDPDSLVANLFGSSDFDSYLEYILDQPPSQDAIVAPQIVGRISDNEFGLVQCPGNISDIASKCPNGPNYPFVHVGQFSGSQDAFLRQLTLNDKAAITDGGGILFMDGIVTAVFPPNVLASDTVFWNTDPTAGYCGGAVNAGNCPLDPTNEFIVQSGEARDYFPDGTNFMSYVRLIFHYCDNDDNGKVDAGTEGVMSATSNGTVPFTYNSLTGDCAINGVPTSGGTIDVDSLAVYNWKTADSVWVRLTGIVDKTNKTISVFSDHFSLYETLGFRSGSQAVLAPLSLTEVRTYPNPFVEQNSIDGLRFAALGITGGSDIFIDIKVYDIRGQEVAHLVDNIPAAAGAPTNFEARKENNSYTLYHWRVPSNNSGKRLASGVYIYYMYARDAAGYEVTKKGKFSVVR